MISSERTLATEGPPPLASLQRSILIGSLGFCLASVAVFATVAFAERWMYATLGLYGAYLIWTVLFIVLGGGVLYLLVKTTMSVAKFYAIFCSAFFFYAVGWVVAYFMLRDGLGEWVASLAGSVLMALAFAIGFKTPPLLLRLAAILIAANSAGYFLGSWLNNTVRGSTGMLLWGAAYGLFLGAGLGASLYFAQTASQTSSRYHARVNSS
jgi:hypothetical protein